MELQQHDPCLEICLDEFLLRYQIPDEVMDEPVYQSTLCWYNGKLINASYDPYHYSYNPTITFQAIRQHYVRTVPPYYPGTRAMGRIVLPKSQFYKIHTDAPRADPTDPAVARLLIKLDPEERERMITIASMVANSIIYPTLCYSLHIGKIDHWPEISSEPGLYEFAIYLFRTALQFDAHLPHRQPFMQLTIPTCDTERKYKICSQIAVLSLDPQKRRDLFFLACFGQNIDDFLEALNLPHL